MKRTGHPHMGCVDGKYKQNGKTTRARTSITRKKYFVIATSLRRVPRQRKNPCRDTRCAGLTLSERGSREQQSARISKAESLPPFEFHFANPARS